MAEVAALLQTARVFALACVEQADGGMDNLPTVIAEAMAAGLPVVSTALAGVPEMVAHGQTGLLVPPRSPEKLADALGEFPDAAVHWRGGTACRGRARARRLFDVRTTTRAAQTAAAGENNRSRRGLTRSGKTRCCWWTAMAGGRAAGGTVSALARRATNDRGLDAASLALTGRSRTNSVNAFGPAP